MHFSFGSKNKQQHQALDALLDNATHSRDYYVLLVGSILLAIGGIFADSIPVLIASMIVAPLAYPILGLGLAITIRNTKLFGKITLLFLASCALTLALALIATYLFSGERANDVYISFTENRYLAIVVAIVAGAIAAYGTLRSKVASAITGVAIAVSLMPPLVASGIGFASGNTVLMNEALILFILNVLGILFASTTVFSLFGLRSSYRVR